MKAETIAIVSLIAVLTVVMVPSKPVGANGVLLKLPTNLATIEVFDAGKSYFNTLLWGVAPGYDVSNGYYAGWCVDRRFTIARKIPIVVTLYSSQNPPLFLEDQRWDMVNYILNHKQGEMTDIQQAMWYFVDFVGNYTPSTASAKEMVNDANLHGAGFIPTTGQAVAVICNPAYGTQVTIIEVTLDSPLQGQGDINNDGNIDIHDAILLAAAFRSKPGDPNWNSKADLNHDGAIDIYDAIIMAVNFGKTYP
jgi:hypothetical protein